MKLRLLHAFLASITALAVFTALLGCDKKTTDQPENTPPGQTTQPVKPAETKGLTTTSAPAVAPAEISVLKDTYGFAARLPMDVEAFSAFYRLHDLWENLSGSKWAAALLDLPAVKENKEFQDAIARWKTEPGVAKAKDIAEAILGAEFIAVEPAGFTARFMPWIDTLQEFQSASLMSGLSGKRQDPDKLLRDLAPELIPALVKNEFPPMFFVSKAIKAKADIDGGVNELLKAAAAKPQPGVEFGEFKLADKYEFRNVTVVAKKLVAAFDEARMQLQLKEMLGDEKKAKDAMTAIMAKRVELAWGWMDDYLILSIGPDHSHLKFAAGEADSALAIPAVARRATQFMAKRPMSLSYGSAAMFEKIFKPVEYSKTFDKVTEELGGILKPEQITGMRADVKRLEAMAHGLFSSKFDPMVGVNFWDGGIRSEVFGGARQTMIDSSKPLAFSGFMSPAVLLLADSRANAATSAKLANFVEEGAATLWGWFEKYGRAMVPEEGRQGAAMAEGVVIPLVKEFWRACRQFSKALGDESAMLVDLNGTMPKLPDVPPPFAAGKIPRIAFIWEMKDRAAVSAAWGNFDKIIKQVLALIPKGENPKQTVPEPQMKKDGDIEVHFIPLPIPTDDLLPHIAISKDRWMISSSPTLSKELAGKSAASGGAPLGTEFRFQFTALWDFAEAWLKLMPKPQPQAAPPDAPPGKDVMVAIMLPRIIQLARSISAFEWRVSEEDGQARNSVFLKLQDLK